MSSFIFFKAKLRKNIYDLLYFTHPSIHALLRDSNSLRGIEEDKKDVSPLEPSIDILISMLLKSVIFSFSLS